MFTIAFSSCVDNISFVHKHDFLKEAKINTDIKRVKAFTNNGSLHILSLNDDIINTNIKTHCMLHRLKYNIQAKKRAAIPMQLNKPYNLVYKYSVTKLFSFISHNRQINMMKTETSFLLSTAFINRNSISSWFFSIFLRYASRTWLNLLFLFTKHTFKHIIRSGCRQTRKCPLYCRLPPCHAR